MKESIYYKISNVDIYSEKHFYKMFRFVFFKQFVFCIDIYPSEMTFSFMFSAYSFFCPGKSFNILVVK